MSLTAEQLREVLDYDPATGIFTWRTGRNQGRRAGYRTARGLKYRSIRIGGDAGTAYYEHRLAWLYVHGAWPSRHLDHRNEDGHDNRIANLRPATYAQNAQNRNRARADNRRGVLGVYRSGSVPNPFRAAITVAGRQHHLGCYPTAEAAHRAYVEAKARLHPFAHTERTA